jgi:7-carboxy-7-deazaguanine synthase (Cx14CxxC type)
MTYRVKEIFYTLQGEGHWTGRPAVFCRFAGCNLWSGREEDRATAICKFCDTDFLHGNKYDLDDLIAEIFVATNQTGCRFIVLTGGEPTLQVDSPLIDALHDCDFYIAIETNGTKPLPAGIDWVCVSPKTPRLRVRSGNELKLVYPQHKVTPDLFTRLPFARFSLSPMDGPNLAANTQAAIDYCLTHPHWSLSIQTHKLIGVP